MKKIALFVLIAFTVFACAKKDMVTINGKVTNPVGEIITILINKDETVDTVTIAEDGTFCAEMEIGGECMASFRNGRVKIPIYLIPGSTVNMELDAKGLENRNTSATKISGPGSSPTALMYKLNNEVLTESIKELLKMRTDSFKMKMDEAIQIVDNEIEKFQSKNSPSSKFIRLIHLTQRLRFAENYYYFINYHKRYAPNDTVPIPKTFHTYIDAIPVDDYESCKELPEYRYFIALHHDTAIRKTLKADTTIQYGTIAYTNKNIDLIAALNVLDTIKNEIGNLLISKYPYLSDSIQEILKTRYKEIINRQEDIEEFEKTFTGIARLKPGATAPTFNYLDITGQMVSTESLKGKVIYIDVWATWCGPCKKEIPHLKKLEEELHNEDIAFVSISVDSEKEKWENIVKEKGLGGYQLHAKKAWKSDIIKNYVIKGIPRFIIIDKEGKLVEANASRPSNPETKNKLLKLVKK